MKFSAIRTFYSVIKIQLRNRRTSSILVFWEYGSIEGSMENNVWKLFSWRKYDHPYRFTCMYNRKIATWKNKQKHINNSIWVWFVKTATAILRIVRTDDPQNAGAKLAAIGYNREKQQWISIVHHNEIEDIPNKLSFTHAKIEKNKTKPIDMNWKRSFFFFFKFCITVSTTLAACGNRSMLFIVHIHARISMLCRLSRNQCSDGKSLLILLPTVDDDCKIIC